MMDIVRWYWLLSSSLLLLNAHCKFVFFSLALALMSYRTNICSRCVKMSRFFFQRLISSPLGHCSNFFLTRTGCRGPVHRCHRFSWSRLWFNTNNVYLNTCGECVCVCTLGVRPWFNSFRKNTLYTCYAYAMYMCIPEWICQQKGNTRNWYHSYKSYGNIVIRFYVSTTVGSARIYYCWICFQLLYKLYAIR